MKLKDYIEELQEIASKYPDVDVVYASDSEGNSFHEVGFSPAVGNYEKYDTFVPETQFEENDMPDAEVNAVCLN